MSSSFSSRSWTQDIGTNRQANPESTHGYNNPNLGLKKKVIEGVGELISIYNPNEGEQDDMTSTFRIFTDTITALIEHPLQIHKDTIIDIYIHDIQDARFLSLLTRLMDVVSPDHIILNISNKDYGIWDSTSLDHFKQATKLGFRFAYDNGLEEKGDYITPVYSLIKLFEKTHIPTNIIYCDFRIKKKMDIGESQQSPELKAMLEKGTNIFPFERKKEENTKQVQESVHKKVLGLIGEATFTYEGIYNASLQEISQEKLVRHTLGTGELLRIIYEAHLGHELFYKSIRSVIEDAKLGYVSNINLSLSDLVPTNFRDSISEIIKKAGGMNKHQASNIFIEISEAAHYISYKMLDELYWINQEIGCSISIDDYSPFDSVGNISNKLYFMLKEKGIAIKEIKIDGAIIENIIDNNYTNDVMSNIITSIRQLHLDGHKIVCEWVKNQNQMSQLSALFQIPLYFQGRDLKKKTG